MAHVNQGSSFWTTSQAIAGEGLPKASRAYLDLKLAEGVWSP